jgi:3-deoxy-manno-octulosonate cytidylyltransferase (CMP-KDO synthetase)
MPTGFSYSRHIGIYAYRCGFLKQFVEYGSCELEKVESLEQLRALWYGHKIVVKHATKDPGIGVDTEEDLKQVQAILKKS